MSDDGDYDDSSDGGSSLDEPRPAPRAHMPAGSLEAFAFRQRAKMMAAGGGGGGGGTLPVSIRLSNAVPASPPAVTPGNSTCAGAAVVEPTGANGRRQSQTQPPPQLQNTPNKPGQPVLHRLNIFVLVRILFHYLEKVDPKLLLQAKQVLKECDKQKKAGNPEYQNLADAIPPRIKNCVGDHHWSKALAIQRQFLKSKQKQTRQATTSTNTNAATPPAVARALAQQQQRSEIVARKFAQAGVLATNEAGAPIGAVPAAAALTPTPEHRPSLRRHIQQPSSRRRSDNAGSGGASDEDDSENDDDGSSSTRRRQAQSHKHGRSQTASPGGSGADDNARRLPAAAISGDSSSSLGEKRGSSSDHYARSNSNASDQTMEAQVGGESQSLSPSGAAAAATVPSAKHKRTVSAPIGMQGVVVSSRGVGRQDSFMRDDRLGTVPSADSSSAASGVASLDGKVPNAAAMAMAAAPSPLGATSLGRYNEYSGQEQQPYAQRRRRGDNDPRAALTAGGVLSPSPPPLSQAPAALQQGQSGLRTEMVSCSGGSLDEAAQRRANQAPPTAPGPDPRFSLTGTVRPFYPSGFSLFQGASVVQPSPPHSDGAVGAPLRRTGSGSALSALPPRTTMGLPVLTAMDGSVGVGVGGNVAMDTRARVDFPAYSDDDDSSEEEAAVVDVEEDEVV